MSLTPHHDDPVRELESVQGDGQAAHLVRQVHHQAPTAATLRRSLSALTGEVSPEQAYRAQVAENAWCQIEREFGLLTAAESPRWLVPRPRARSPMPPMPARQGGCRP